MGSSFTRLDGFGYWARDTDMVVFMATLVHEMDKSPTLTLVQREFRADLILEARLCITGAVSDGLDYVAGTQSLREWAIEIGRSAVDTLTSHGPMLDAVWIRDVMAAKGAPDTGAIWSTPVPSSGVIAYGTRWVQLLSGEFTPLPPHPSGQFHATGEIEIDLTQGA